MTVAGRIVQVVFDRGSQVVDGIEVGAHETNYLVPAENPLLVVQEIAKTSTKVAMTVTEK